jgi:hypothetical protein
LELDALSNDGTLEELAPRFREFGAFDDWPTGERAAVLEYLTQRWTDALEQPSAGWSRADDVLYIPLGALGAISGDITSALTQWVQFRTAEYAANLADALEYEVYYLRIKFSGPLHSFWTPESEGQFLDWLDSADTYATVAARSERSAYDEREALARCVALLEERERLRNP